MLPFELVLHMTQFINDKSTLLSMRLVNKTLHSRLKTITWNDTNQHKINFNTHTIKIYLNNILVRDVFFRCGYYKYTEYMNGMIKFQLVSSRFKTKKYIYHPGSVEVTEYDANEDLRDHKIHYAGLCAIS